MNDRATIYALSSGAPPAGIAVMRISGPAAAGTLYALSGRAIPPRSPCLVTVKACDGTVLDRALALRFVGPASATGEDVVELHLHGGRAVVASVLGELARHDGLRAAEPGEFTRRALENGRIDLMEAEGLADLLAAETRAQHRQAIAQASGTLSRQIDTWQDRCLNLAAGLEGAIDFSDEDDVSPHLMESLHQDMAALASDVGYWLARPTVERVRDGVSVVIAGPPNAGKSTLLNALVQRDAAIVSPIAGTTRDIVEIPVAIDGVAFRISDTAGMRDAAGDPIEAIGIARANDAVRDADIVLWLGPADAVPDRETVVIVAAKADLACSEKDPVGIAVSARTGSGLDSLIATVFAAARALLPKETEVALNRRQRAELRTVADALSGSAAYMTDPVIVAEALRAALTGFDRLTGRAGTEAMLDALFGRFCIGK